VEPELLPVFPAEDVLPFELLPLLVPLDVEPRDAEGWDDRVLV
jgi:hypothetical protein